jgi:hypothetical protein
MEAGLRAKHANFEKQVAGRSRKVKGKEGKVER